MFRVGEEGSWVPCCYHTTRPGFCASQKPEVYGLRLGWNARCALTLFRRSSGLGDHRKSIGAEGRGGQTFFAVEIAHRIVAPSVSHGDGLGDAGGGDFDLVGTDELAGGPGPFFIFATDSKSFHFLHIEGVKTAAEGVECDDGFVALDFDALVLRATVRDFDTIVFGECQTHKAVGDIAFVTWMDVASFADIDDHCLAAVLDGVLSLCLTFTQLCPVAVAGLGLLGFEIGELHPIEGEIALLPLVAPVLDHEWEEVAVFISAGGIAFALIPNGTFDAIADGWEQNAVVDVTGAAVSGKLLLGALRGTLAELDLFRFSFFSTLFPCCQGCLVALLSGIAGEIFFSRHPTIHEGLETSILLQHIAAHPGLRGAAAPSVIDQAHRHVERLMQCAAEEETDGAKAAHIGGRALSPCAFEVVLRLLRADLRHRNKADVRELRRGDLQVGVIALRNTPLHV
ncbi:unannotated protein [freshwater metagenome]|uniref:Unannotated protein n=1 Tax=freshwater metagenome TaxID=449393 RepID=A0A6J6F932_9ZZZZ